MKQLNKTDVFLNCGMWIHWIKTKVKQYIGKLLPKLFWSLVLAWGQKRVGRDKEQSWDKEQSSLLSLHCIFLEERRKVCRTQFPRQETLWIMWAQPSAVGCEKKGNFQVQKGDWVFAFRTVKVLAWPTLLEDGNSLGSSSPGCSCSRTQGSEGLCADGKGCGFPLQHWLV